MENYKIYAFKRDVFHFYTLIFIFRLQTFIVNDALLNNEETFYELFDNFIERKI